MIQDDIDVAVTAIRNLNPFIREIVLQLSKEKFDAYKLEPNKVNVSDMTECNYIDNTIDLHKLRIRIVYNNFGEQEVTSYSFYIQSQR